MEQRLKELEHKVDYIYRWVHTHDAIKAPIPVPEPILTWCGHIKRKMSISAGKERWFFNRCGHDYYIADDWAICPICKKERP